jgi:hypothetical protein
MWRPPSAQPCQRLLATPNGVVSPPTLPFAPPLPTLHEWLGGAMAVDGLIYGVPSRSWVTTRYLLVIDPSNDAVSLIATSLTAQQGTWQTAIAAPNGA